MPRGGTRQGAGRKPGSQKTKTAFSLDNSVIKWLKKKSEATGLSKSRIVNDLLVNELIKQENEND